MTDKLSERLETMAGSSMFDMEEVCELLEEAAELARRVEGGTLVEWNYRAGVVRPDWYGQHVRLVPEASDKGNGNG